MSSSQLWWRVSWASSCVCDQTSTTIGLYETLPLDWWLKVVKPSAPRPTTSSPALPRRLLRWTYCVFLIRYVTLKAYFVKTAKLSSLIIKAFSFWKTFFKKACCWIQFWLSLTLTPLFLDTLNLTFFHRVGWMIKLSGRHVTAALLDLLN